MSVVDNFGSFLRHERELRGVQLEEVAQKTKIHLRFLQALEKNDYDNLPGEVFVKGFIRGYAKAIGGNADEIVSAYEEAVGHRRSQEMREVLLEREKKEMQKRDNARLAIGIVIAVILSGSVYFLINGLSHKKSVPAVMQPSPPPAAPPVQTSLPTSDDGSSVGASLPVETGTISSPAPAGPATSAVSAPQPVDNREKPPPGESKNDIIKPEKKTGMAAEAAKEPPSTASTADKSRLALKIQTEQRSWFKLKVDNNKEMDFTMSEGSVETFFGNESFQLTVGNRPGTKVFLNETPVSLPPAGENNVVRDFIITKKLNG